MGRDFMMKQSNQLAQGAAKQQRTAGSFFHRLSNSTQLLFRGKAFLQGEAAEKIVDANSLIGKSDDYETGQKYYARAVKLLRFAALKGASVDEKTHELLADAYLGLAVCKWANGQDDSAELRNAILHANQAIWLNGTNQNAWSTKKEAARRLKG